MYFITKSVKFEIDFEIEKFNRSQNMYNIALFNRSVTGALHVFCRQPLSICFGGD